MTVSASTQVIADRIAQIRQGLPGTVRLIAVTKQVSVDLMRAAYDAGVRDFGESRVQEAIAKQTALADLTDITWHFIGHLQGNKAAKALEHFQWIHSLDSLKLAQRLDQLAASLDEKPNVLLQVKIRPDPNKSGWTAPGLLEDLAALNECIHLQILGLMSIPPYGLTDTDTLAVFQQTAELAAQIDQRQSQHLQMQHLSMGMSGDYKLAVQAGSTMIRLGQVLFGERN